MPQIEISESDFGRLKKIAEPLVDTTATVVTKILDYFERHNGAAPGKTPDRGWREPNLHEFSPTELPSLVHAKMLAGTFDGRKPDKTTWDSLLRLALVTTFKRAKTVSELRRLSGANLAESKKTDEGYKPMPGYAFAYQGVSASDAAKCILRCARAIGCEASFEFEWRDKEGAFLPGQRARVKV